MATDGLPRRDCRSGGGWAAHIDRQACVPGAEESRMLQRLRPRSAYDVIALLALFVAVGTGGAYAANTIGSTDVIDESLLSQDIKNGQVANTDLASNAVTSAKIANFSVANNDLRGDAVTTSRIKAGNVGVTDLATNAVTGAKVADDSLTGADVQESSLGKVPEADTLDGNDSTDFLGVAATAADSELLGGRDPKSFARLGGVINGDGSVLQGTGFTVSRLNDGEYQVSFPAGTLSNALCPPVVTAITFSGLVRNPQLSSRSCSGFGAGSFTIKTLDGDGVAHDTPFLFIAM
jgi:hypothetical protein